MKTFCWTTAFVVLAACARREPIQVPPTASTNAVVALPSATALLVTSAPVVEAVKPAAPETKTGCDAFDTGDDASEEKEEARVTAKAKSIYSEFVLRRKLDDRALSKHPVLVHWQGYGSGPDTRECVASEAKFIVFGKPESIDLERRYEITSLEFNDAADGESAYSFFVDRATGKVSVILQYSNFEP